MDGTNKAKVVGIFGFIGSGKSHLTRSLKCLEGFNPISKEEVGIEWYKRTYGNSTSEGYERALYQEFKTDSLFLLNRSLGLIDPRNINVIDSVNTPLEDSFLRANYDYLLVQIWRSRKERMQGILNGRIKLVTSSEPTDRDSFNELDNLVKRYSHEGGCLHSLADAIIVNKGQDLCADFMDVLKSKWK